MTSPANSTVSVEVVSQLSGRERWILAAVRRTGRLVTRIKERGDGDVEFFQPPLQRSSGGGEDYWRGMSEADVISCLHSLEGRGLLSSLVSVNRASTTEYICEWRLR
jgi:hypothetical protein